VKPKPNWTKSDWNDWHKNTLWVPLTTIILTGRSILLRQSKPRSPSESVPCWDTSCNKFACAKHSLFYWGPVRKIMPDWSRCAVGKRLPIPGVTEGGAEGWIVPLAKLNVKTGAPLSLYSVLVFFWFSVGKYFIAFFWVFSGDVGF